MLKIKLIDLIKFTLACTLILYQAELSAIELALENFSIKAYTQNIDAYISPADPDYTDLLLSPQYQKKQLEQFYQHYFASDAQGLSPWNLAAISSILASIKEDQLQILADFGNQEHYAANFRKHGKHWLDAVRRNMNLDNLDTAIAQAQNRAIVIANTFARAMPELAPDFLHASLPGQGFPFDNLQESALWVGTPVYVLNQSTDKAWMLVRTPDLYQAWVKSEDIAYVSDKFMHTWQQKAYHQLVAITKTASSVVDLKQNFQFSAYIGAVFPLKSYDKENIAVLIPLKGAHQQAIISTGFVAYNDASLMPLAATKKNIVKIIQQLKNRPYGWGGAFFFNDCSQELKSIFSPLGIWLPRNSRRQSQLNSGLDLSSSGIDERLEMLKTKGRPLLTLIYIGGHIMLYVGIKDGVPITYQNLWGLSTKDRRYVVGQSLFLPLLKSYPEKPEADSLAGKSYFKLIYLDNLELGI